MLPEDIAPQVSHGQLLLAVGMNGINLVAKLSIFLVCMYTLPEPLNSRTKPSPPKIADPIPPTLDTLYDSPVVNATTWPLSTTTGALGETSISLIAPYEV